MVGRAGTHSWVDLVSGLDAAATRAWAEAFLTAAERQAAALGELDREAGDGDFGTNLTTAVRRARAGLEGEVPTGPGGPFTVLSKAFMATGGTSGPLYGMWFRELGKAAGDDDELAVAQLGVAVRCGLDAVCRLGGAAPGDKTMIDAIAPAADALETAVAEGRSVGEALSAAARAARAGTEATAELIARRGRATWVGEVARGVVDPGAATVAVFFETAPSDRI